MRQPGRGKVYAELFRLNGRAAFVTGGSRGIGFACAEALGEAGARVAISARSRDEGEKAVRQLRQKGIEAIYLPADISNESAAQQVVRQAAAELGGLDILVNNAGIARHCDSLKLEPETWDEVINTNLTGLFWCCRAAIETMSAAGRGSIVNIGSISGYISNLPQNQVAYNASKAGVHMLTKSLAGEFAKSNIRINAVAPAISRRR
ncbi:glucose 1-dehydrogenase [Sinorhizobium meliloti]|nr:glucose 1-dehydrogenase [Sinorhizobium meliloti]